MHDYIPIEIDINGDIGEVAVRQYDNDSRFLHFVLTDHDAPDGDTVFKLVGCTARLLVSLGENSFAYIDGEIVVGENGILTFLPPGSVTQTAGLYPARFVCQTRMKALSFLPHPLCCGWRNLSGETVRLRRRPSIPHWKIH